VTATFVRVLAVIVVLAVAAGLAALVWSARGPSDEERFREEMAAVCREMFPAMRTAPDLETALARSGDFRSRLALLAPPENLELAFYNFSAALEQAETAARNGWQPALMRADAAERQYAQELGLGEVCSPGAR
jgi:hypothetical protein